MQKLYLKTLKTLQGEFKPGELNVLLVFQVNCPGCFAYALPLANEIYKRYGDGGFKMLGLATAFEDFEYNSEQNAELLLKDGTLVGETKRYLEENGMSELPYSIDYLVAIDYPVENPREFYTPEDARRICMTKQGFENLSSDEQDNALTGIMRNIEVLGPSSYTFTVNMMRGTPTWVVFDGDMNILEHWFGHRDNEAALKLIDQYKNRYIK